jgi:hypothetical protein
LRIFLGKFIGITGAALLIERFIPSHAYLGSTFRASQESARCATWASPFRFWWWRFRSPNPPCGMTATDSDQSLARNEGQMRVDDDNLDASADGLPDTPAVYAHPANPSEGSGQLLVPD